MTNWMEEKKTRSKMLGQIHDSMVLDVHPEEFNQIMRMAKYIMTIKIMDRFPWLIVPMEVEFEATPINGSWYQKREVKQRKCRCGSDWMHQTKLDDGAIKWDCPLCGRKEIQE